MAILRGKRVILRENVVTVPELPLALSYGIVIRYVPVSHIPVSLWLALSSRKRWHVKVVEINFTAVIRGNNRT